MITFYDGNQIVSGDCMTETSQKMEEKIVEAIDSYKTIAQQLIDKLILETGQPAMEEIEKGNYYEIQNAPLINGKEFLSGNWSFAVHGEHCLFRNLLTGQTLEVSLGDRESVGNLDPYFFYNFLQTTERYKLLAKNFNHGFGDMLKLFEEMERQGVLTHVYGVQYRKIETAERQGKQYSDNNHR